MAQTTQPALNDLLAGYLERQTAARAEGLAVFDSGEVALFESGAVQPIDPRLAWEEAVAVERWYGPSLTGPERRSPTNWPQLVAGQEPAVALALCCGNFPQLVRDFHGILQEKDLGKFRPTPSRPITIPELEAWAGKAFSDGAFPRVLLAAGVLRLARQFSILDALLPKLTNIPDPWQRAWENEKAALAWHRGECKEALESWKGQEPSIPVLFNCGMAELFAGNKEGSRQALAKARAGIPETSAWHHLAGLYEALSQRQS